MARVLSWDAKAALFVNFCFVNGGTNALMQLAGANKFFGPNALIPGLSGGEGQIGSYGTFFSE